MRGVKFCQLLYMLLYMHSRDKYVDAKATTLYTIATNDCIFLFFISVWKNPKGIKIMIKKIKSLPKISIAINSNIIAQIKTPMMSMYNL